jgi:predicted metal-dependent enzyme (double-stranded beta helix superfamily)
MSKFDLGEFVEGCKRGMADADDRHEAARAFLQQILDAHDADQIIEVLEASVPPGANIGELILHADADLTVLYGRVPPRFQSAIHNHTIFACIGALRGDEENTFYERAEDGAGLRQVRTTRVKAGRVIGLPSDVIHSIANPGDDTGRALHIYGGDFGAVMGERSLWSADTHEEIPFSFEGLVKESIKTMKRDDNEAGLRAVAAAIPETAPMIYPLLS